MKRSSGRLACWKCLGVMEGFKWKIQNRSLPSPRIQQHNKCHFSGWESCGRSNQGKGSSNTGGFSQWLHGFRRHLNQSDTTQVSVRLVVLSISTLTQQNAIIRSYTMCSSLWRSGRLDQNYYKHWNIDNIVCLRHRAMCIIIQHLPWSCLDLQNAIPVWWHAITTRRLLDSDVPRRPRWNCRHGHNCISNEILGNQVAKVN